MISRDYTPDCEQDFKEAFSVYLECLQIKFAKEKENVLCEYLKPQ